MRKLYSVREVGNKIYALGKPIAKRLDINQMATNSKEEKPHKWICIDNKSKKSADKYWKRIGRKQNSKQFNRTQDRMVVGVSENTNDFSLLQNGDNTFDRNR